MNENTEKRRPKSDAMKTLCVNYLSKQFEVDRNYIYAILKGTLKPPISDDVKSAYNKKYAELKQVLS